MNILTDDLPKKIRINNNIYDINYDYKTAIRIITAFEDPELTYNEQIYIMMKNLYKEEVREEDYSIAVEKAIKFIDLGKERDESKKKEHRIYSFNKDANYIYTGINMTHHIDVIEKEDLHWWKFMSFFMDMSPKCMFGELIYYRKRKAEGKLTKEEEKEYKKLKDIIELEDVSKPSMAKKKFYENYNKNMKKRGV